MAIEPSYVHDCGRRSHHLGGSLDRPFICDRCACRCRSSALALCRSDGNWGDLCLARGDQTRSALADPGDRGRGRNAAGPGRCRLCRPVPRASRIAGSCNLAARLNSGTRPAEALEISRGLVTHDAVLLAWVGEAAGLLPKALRIAAASRSSQLPIWTSIAARVSYILILLLSMQMICGFIMYFIVPKLEAISMDFKIALPEVTIFVIHASQFAVKYAAPALLLPFAEVGLLILLPFSFLGWGSYSVPVFDRVLGARHSALVLRCLSLFVEAGKPIALGLATLRSHYPAYWVKRRLTQAESDVRHGTDWIQALWQQRLIGTADAHVLASAEAVGNLSWACAELAQTLERRLAVRFQMLIQALFPLAVVMLGMVVFILATAYFLPLVNIIQSLT